MLEYLVNHRREELRMELIAVPRLGLAALEGTLV